MPVNIRIEPILPKNKAYPLSVMIDIEDAIMDLLLNEVGPDVQEKYQNQVKGWSSPPQFPVKAIRTASRARLGVSIIPRGKGLQKWKWVNKGTGPRTFSSRRGTIMVFPENFTPKTTPQGGYGGPGKKYGQIRRARVVHDHRIEPREFEDKIVTPAWKNRVKGRVQGVIVRAISRHND